MYGYRFEDPSDCRGFYDPGYWEDNEMILTCPHCKVYTHHNYVFAGKALDKPLRVGQWVRCLECHLPYIVTGAHNGDTHTTPNIPVLSVGDTDRAEAGVPREEHGLR